MVHKPTIKDEETNHGPSTYQRLKTKRQTMVHKPTIKDEETNYAEPPFSVFASSPATFQIPQVERL
jgi:hypothetical protein